MIARPHPSPTSIWTVEDKEALVNWCLNHLRSSTACELRCGPSAHMPPCGTPSELRSPSPTSTPSGPSAHVPHSGTPKGENTIEEIATDLIYDIPNSTLGETLQAAIYNIMPKAKQRKISHVTNCTWFRPLLIRTLASRLQNGDSRPFKGLPIPIPPPRPQHPPAPNDRQIHRLNRQVKSLREDIQVLTDIILEAFGNIPNFPLGCGPSGATRAEPAREPKAHWVCPTGHANPNNQLDGRGSPVIAVVGLRRHQQQDLKQRLKDIAIVEFVDFRHRRPSQLLDFDRVYCLPLIEQKWKREAMHLLGDRFIEHRGTALIVDAIERLAGVSV